MIIGEMIDEAIENAHICTYYNHIHSSFNISF